MSILATLSLTAAAFSVIFMWMNLKVMYIPGFLITAILAFLGFLKPADDNSVSGRSNASVRADRRRGRTACFFAVLMAALPFVRPYVQAFALKQREKVRARETANQYKAFDTSIQQLTPLLAAFYQQHGTLPASETAGPLPVFRSDGTMIDFGKAAPITAPTDPFNNTRTLSVHPVGAFGVLVVSVGQDGVSEFPPPRQTITIDAQPNDPTAPFAATGVDFRLLTYDPTNGSLSTGDLTAWIGNGDFKRDQVFQRLDDAWNSVNALTPLTSNEDPDLPSVYLPEDDAKTAQSCYNDGKWLAALASASRAVYHRAPHPNQWKTNEVKRADFIRGYSLFQLGHSRAGADSFIDYLAVFPNETDAHYWLGIALFLGGDRDNARKHLAASFELAPQGPLVGSASAIYSDIRSNRIPSGIPQRAIITDPFPLQPPIPVPLAQPYPAQPRPGAPQVPPNQPSAPR